MLHINDNSTVPSKFIHAYNEGMLRTNRTLPEFVWEKFDDKVVEVQKRVALVYNMLKADGFVDTDVAFGTSLVNYPLATDVNGVTVTDRPTTAKSVGALEIEMVRRRMSFFRGNIEVDALTLAASKMQNPNGANVPVDTTSVRLLTENIWQAWHEQLVNGYKPNQENGCPGLLNVPGAGTSAIDEDKFNGTDTTNVGEAIEDGISAAIGVLLEKNFQYMQPSTDGQAAPEQFYLFYPQNFQKVFLKKFSREYNSETNLEMIQKFGIKPVLLPHLPNNRAVLVYKDINTIEVKMAMEPMPYDFPLGAFEDEFGVAAMGAILLKTNADGDAGVVVMS